MPGVVDQQHHHRSTTKTTHKPYKSRFASKNALKDLAKGKVDKEARRTPHQHVMNKFDRRNQAKQKRLNKSQDHAQVTGVFHGKDGAPRNVAVISLCEDLDSSRAVRQLNASVDAEEDIPSAGNATVHIDRFKQKLLYKIVPRELWSALSACQTADYVLFLLSPEKEVDQLGELLIRSIESQGITTVYTAVLGLDQIEPAKRRPQIQSSLKSFITHFFPDQEKVFSLDARQECSNLVRSFCTTTPRGIRWRDERSWMTVEDVHWGLGDATSGNGEISVTGVVRGQNLKTDRLVQLGDWGTFQIDRITAAPNERTRKAKGNAMTVDAEGENAVLDAPTEDQDTLQELAPEEVVMQDTDMAALSIAPTERRGVLLDDQHYFSEDEAEDEEAELSKPKRLPRGTSKYQAAWYLGDMSDSGSDMESVSDLNDEEDIGMTDDIAAGPADGLEGHIPATDPTEIGASEYPQSEPFEDRDMADEINDLQAFRAEKDKEADEDARFPDEIELHPNVLARERLAKYRGLKSLRTSPWDIDEDRLYQPSDWDRLLDVEDYKGARNKVLRDTLVGGVRPGTRVHVYLRNVPLSLQTTYDPSRPLSLFSLLKHEFKHTAMNFSFTLSSDHEDTIKSKEELVIQYGPRRFLINPIFSSAGNTPNDVHKFERFLRPGRTVVASFTAPMMWGSAPALFFKRSSSSQDDQQDGQTDPENTMMDTTTPTTSSPSTTPPALQLIGHGTSLAPSTSRIIAKRAVLTGQPYKIHRRVVTIRYMFFNKEDVAWFKALPLWTNRGRQGAIKESLGTHGYFKASFDAKMTMQDAVGVSLYKRVWPRSARAFLG